MSVTSKLAGQATPAGPSALAESWQVLGASCVRGHGSGALTHRPPRADIRIMTEPDSDHDPFALCRRFGTTVVEVPCLRRRAVYVGDVDVALIRSGLDRSASSKAARWVMAEALRRRAAQSTPY